jgi:hypothetical protein
MVKDPSNCIFPHIDYPGDNDNWNQRPLDLTYSRNASAFAAAKT